MIATSVNPPLTDALIDRLVDIWIATTEAGGSVGFEPPVTRAQVADEVATYWDQRLDGSLDLVVASDGAVVVGFGFLQPGRGVSAHTGEISKLQRDPTAAGRGVGGVVLMALEDLAVARGLTLVSLTVRQGTGRDAYYAERGYAQVATLPGWLRIAGRPTDLLVMSKAVGAGAGTGVSIPSPAPDLPAPVPGGSEPSDQWSRGVEPRPPRGPRIPVRRLDPDLPLPTYARSGDAGMDLHARRRMVLPPGARALMPTGIAVAVPEGYVGLVHPRSGLAIRAGLSIVNSPGTIDAGYRGELLVPLINLDPSATIRLDRGDRIAQMLVQRVEEAVLIEVDELPEGVRGEGGFGSTGR